MRNISLIAAAPLVLARRIALIIERRMPTPLWLSMTGGFGVVLVVASFFLSSIAQWLVMGIGLFMIAALVLTMGQSLSYEKAFIRSNQAAHGLELMGNGISNPKQHLKQNPELVEAHAGVARELGLSLIHSEYSADERLLMTLHC
jgi:hypothetical protein